MFKLKSAIASTLLAAVTLSVGCAAPSIKVADFQRPDRPEQLSSYDVFVGDWTWEATMTNADEANQQWSGTAQWGWSLNDRYLHGMMSAKSADAQFDSAGAWGWNSRCGGYTWWMFNDWGYSQEGTASHDADARKWTMNYTSTGLDGTPSHGCYKLSVIDDDTIEWELGEWADMMHMFPKMEMTGVYKRKK